jgi:ubiquinone/menaquinone biosynthesis C-methylase UbiE
VLAPKDVEELPDQSFDLIVLNSVVQYLTMTELNHLLTLWRRLLAPGGTLIVADVIPPDVGKLSDVLALFRLASQHGFLLATLGGLARTAISPYRKLRSTLGIAQYTEAEFLAKLKAAGYAAERLRHNLEHNQARMTFRANLA